MGYVIGIDVGSQCVKALLFDDQGNRLGAARAPYLMSHPANGWAEQQPEDWERAVAVAVRAVRAGAGIMPDDVTTVGLACQLDGLVALDEELYPVRPAILWLDRRATRQSAALCAAVGEAALARRTGLIPDASHTAPKAMWLRDEEPGYFKQTRWLTSVGGHLNGWLTGEMVQDHANASSTLLYDLRRREWSDELIAHAGLDPELLPEIRPAGEVIGRLRPRAAEQLGLSERCQVIVGTGVDHAAALGAGALSTGVVVDIVGTAEAVVVPAVDAVHDDERLIETHAHAVDGLLLVENPGFVSGGSTGWWAGLHGTTQAELFGLAEMAPPGSDGALFLPTLSGATAPRWNDRMRGCFAGLSLTHDAAHMARAVLEGCGYALRDIVDRFAQLGLAGDEIRVVGAGARSPLWLQIRADITGRPVRVVQGDCAAGVGAAMLASVAGGGFDDIDEAVSQTVRLADEPILPRPEHTGTYGDGYGAYRRLFDGVEGALAAP